MFKHALILALVLLGGCVVSRNTPGPTPTPTPAPSPFPIPPPPTPVPPVPPVPPIPPPPPPPVPPTPPPTPPVPPVPPEPSPISGYSIPRDVYDSISIGVTMDQFKATITGAPVMTVIQPDGGVMLRYPVLDSDGLWRNRYANFVFSKAGILLRKPIS